MIKQIMFMVLLFVCQNILAQKNIAIKFENIANGKKIVLNDSVYTNAFGEKYTVSKLKYYICNVQFENLSSILKHKNVYLVNANIKDSIKLNLPKRNISGISFQLGVDSILNCSGPQDGALDPLNDMFWTWNSGYVNFKLEGKSENSTAINNKVEQHIGGYKAPYKTMQTIFIPLPKDYFKNRNSITIQMDLDKYWSSTNNIQIANKPVISSPGEFAFKASENFLNMFSLKNEN